MSKNIIIQEGGIAKQMTVNKLKTDLVGGGTCLWVPEDGTILGTKFISENGTYRASDDGYYGYSEVTVNGQGVVSGKDPDGSGDDAVAHVDPETGEIVIEKIPSSIRVVTPPTNPYGIYTNGQAITKDGMVVKGYLESGGEWGTVPNAEVTLDPTTAVYDASTDKPTIDTPDYKDTGSVTITKGASLSSIIANVIAAVNLEGSAPNVYEKAQPIYVGDTSLLSKIGHMGVAMHNVTSSYYSGTVRSIWGFDNSIIGTTINLPDSLQASVEVQVVFSTTRAKIGVGSYKYTLTPTVNITSGNIAAGILYIGTYRDGENWAISGLNATAGPAGSHQNISVTWPRTPDGRILETSFEVLVAPPLYGGGDS